MGRLIEVTSRPTTAHPVVVATEKRILTAFPGRTSVAPRRRARPCRARRAGAIT